MACESQIRDALTGLLERACRDRRIEPVLPIPAIVEAMEVIAEGLFWRRAVDPAFDARRLSETLLQMIGGLIRPVPPAAVGGTMIPETTIPETV